MKMRGKRLLAGVLAVVMLIQLGTTSMYADTVVEESQEIGIQEEGQAEVSEDAKASDLEAPNVVEGAEAEEGDSSTEQVEEMKTSVIAGTILLPEEHQNDEIKVYLYDRTTYIKDNRETPEREDAQNIPLREVICDKDGFFYFEQVEFGSYLLEYYNVTSGFDKKLYELDPEYEAQLAKEEVLYQNAYEGEMDYGYFGTTKVEVSGTEEQMVSLMIREIPVSEDENNTEENETNLEKPELEEKAPEEGTKEELEEVEQIIEEKRKELEEETEYTKDELAELSPEELGASEESDIKMGFFSRLARSLTGNTWSFDTYYVGETDSRYTKKTKDFSLKYQWEFHTTEDIEANMVEIRLPATLLSYRNGTEVKLSDAAVSYGTPDNYVEGKKPFNYYIDTETDEVVFFNYAPIEAGKNYSVQAHFKGLSVMQIKDGTQWSLEPKATVYTMETTGEGEEATEERVPLETKTSTPLTGEVDTEVRLNSVTKKAYNTTGKSYTPGLYTKSQVESYIAGSLPEKYASNFNDYVYVVWEIGISGSATQPWNLLIKDSTNKAGEIVGYSTYIPSQTIEEGEYEGYQVVSSNNSSSDVGTAIRNSNGSKGLLHVVTAYPVGEAETMEGVIFRNNVDVVLQPYDKIDADQKKSAEAFWSYKNYEWKYKPGYLTNTTKRANQTNTNLKGWLEAYEELEGDRGGLSFTTSSLINGYHFTHEIEGQKVGQPKEGKTYQSTTVDDFLYAYSSNDASDLRRLTDEDYYFSRVSVTQRDTGYDVWEDRGTTPEEAGNLVISVMYAGETTWKEIQTIPWNGSGSLNHTLTGDQLAGQPWRVKAEHETINYSTSCTISVDVKVRKDSPVMEELMDEENGTSITIQNVSGLVAEEKQDHVTVNYVQQQGTENYANYPENLLSETKDLYETVAERDSASITLNWLNQTAGSYKTITGTKNDVANERVKVNYALTAHDGYEIFSQDILNELRAASSDLISPGRNEVVFYDLLPIGVKFDPTAAIVAGRTPSMDSNGSYRRIPSSWDKSQVQVNVDSKNDIVTNYRGTGRTLVRFHISYSGADPTFYSNGRWLEGWGVSFGAYYEWKDVDIVDRVPNVSAFMPEDSNNPLRGTENQVYKDNGSIPSDIYRDLVPTDGDLDGDGDKEERNILYASTSGKDDILLAADFGVHKRVKADADRFGIYSKQAVVEKEAGYTYELEVNNLSGTISDVVIFDRLERGTADETNASQWQGTFEGLNVKALEAKDIAPQVYYNANQDAIVSTGTTTGQSVLTTENGWIKEADWSESLSQVKAIAVDISKKKDGTNFELVDIDAVSFEIRLTAPKDVEEGQIYAYNHADLYFNKKLGTSGTELGPQNKKGSDAKVALAGAQTIEVMKEFKGEIPSAVANTEFEFVATQKVDGKEVKLNDREYTLWTLEEGTWKQEEGLYATGANGKFYLHAGEKAVFSDIAGSDLITIKESESPFWKQTKTDVEGEKEGDRKITFQNEFQPVLYAQKVLSAPKNVDTSKDTFTFQVLLDGEPLKEADFWYVDQARTDGGIPTKKGEGKTDKNGCFTIKGGQVAAIMGGKAGATYTVKEVEGANEEDRWFNTSDSVSGTLAVKGSVAKITNYYRLKDFYLTKEVTFQKASDCTQEFTFQVSDEQGNAVVGNEWVVVDKNGIESTEEGESGTLDKNGTFTVALAGKTVKIKDLRAGEEYTITETKYGDLYQPVGDGSVTVTMPKFGDSEEGMITNEYLKRSFSATKILLTDENDVEAKDAEFIMTASVDGKLLKNTEYLLQENGKTVEGGPFETDEDGCFILKNGQVATFTEVGMKGDTFTVKETPHEDYTQVFPSEGEAYSGTLGNGENKAIIINGGGEGSLLLQKEYVGLDEISERAIGELLREQMAVNVTLTITEEDQTYSFPKTDQMVKVIDTETGSIQEVLWKAGEAFTLYPKQLINLTGFTNETSYRFAEAKENQEWMYPWEDAEEDWEGWLEVKQQTPENYAPAAGSVGETPLVTIVNQVKAVAPEGITIHKQMRKSSEVVPEGMELTWRLEEYDGSVWNPKSEVSYLTLDGKGVTCNGVQKTESDGKILLRKTANGYPKVSFLEEQEVHLGVTTGSKGDLRLVEVVEESDPEWGFLAGYADQEGVEIVDLDKVATDAVGFVNSNGKATLEIAKEMETLSDDTFTMILKQITEVQKKPITGKEDILSSEPRGGISYTVFDSETNQVVGSGVTTAGGEMKLKAGQYISIELPDATLWTVEESVVKPYNLEKLEVNTEEALMKLDHNLLLLQPTVEVEELEGLPWEKYDPEKKNTYMASGIEWRVLTVTEDGYALITTEYLQGRSYFNTNYDPTYEGSILDKNTRDFYNTTLTDYDQAIRSSGSEEIPITSYAVGSNYLEKTEQWNSTVPNAGMSKPDETQDATCFTLSYQEESYNGYFADNNDRIALDQKGGSSQHWWARTKGVGDTLVCGVLLWDGSVNNYHSVPDTGHYWYMRPSLWIKLK